MKRKLFAGLLAAVIALTGSPAVGGVANVVYAEDVVTEITSEKIALNDASLAGEDGFFELSVGEEVLGYSNAVDASGKKLNFETEWRFVTDEELSDVGLAVQFYSKYDDAKKASEDTNRVVFDGVIPAGAFGKYVYKWVAAGLLDDAGNLTSDIAFKLLRSVYPVTDWGDTDYQTFCLNDNEKTVSVYSIYNNDTAFSASFQKIITVGGKKYAINAIGDYALDNTNGSSGLRSVTMHSGITSIGKEAFKGAKNLKTIKIKGKITSVGKNAFNGINKKAVFKIKASAADYKKIVSLIKKSGVTKTVTFKRI
ncbi:MAG: leucine-rich repeat domain-containing protein [Lachnospiraceae bacterium]|nr:leucine-rich repeat domain-containing protein [Lachnospiraceae bacterium]